MIKQDFANLQYLISKAATFAKIGKRQKALEILEQIKQKKPETAKGIDRYIMSL